MTAPAEANQTGEKGDLHDEAKPEVWSAYRCRSIKFGSEHPGKLVEASVLASTPLPKATYPIQDSLSSQIENGTLSSMQLEGVRPWLSSTRPANSTHRFSMHANVIRMFFPQEHGLASTWATQRVSEKDDRSQV